MTHLSAERFRFSAGYEAVHVPFRGGPEDLTEVISDRVDYYFRSLGTALPHLREGRLLTLAVIGSKGASALPNVPSTVEANFRLPTIRRGSDCSSRRGHRGRSSSVSMPRPPRIGGSSRLRAARCARYGANADEPR